MKSAHPERELEHVLAHRKSLIERFQSEIAFARKLAVLEGESAAHWAALIDKAVEAFEPVASGSLEAAGKALADAEAIMAPIGEAAKQHTVHCVGHGHIDMNWMWGWPETVAVTNDTFTTVLKLMDEFPTFKYTQSQASVYEIARVHNPEQFERIKARVKEGRWEVAASHWVEGDKNLASGESLTRHLLYTRAFFLVHFGLKPEDVVIDWSPDTFGHAHSLPTIDSRGGVKRYYLCRGGDTYNPPLFWWVGPDGARILAYRDIRWYNSAIEPNMADALLEFREATGLKDYMQMYGVGDHGGGPTRRDLRRCLDMNAWPIFPNFRFAVTNDFFSIAEANGDSIPEIRRELNYEFSGCYTSQSEIKKNNRHGENACAEAEVCATLAHVAAGKPYPGAALRNAWVDVLFSHFHDILPGSGVRDTRTFNQGMYQQVAAITGQVKTQALRALAAAVDTSFAGERDKTEVPPKQEAFGLGGGAGRNAGDGGLSDFGPVVDGPRPVVVFNPTAWQRDEVVRATVWDAQSGISPGDVKKKTFVVKRPDGSTVAAQRVGSGDYWGHQFVDVVFPASVGPMAYSAYSIEEGDAAASEPGVTVTAEAEGKDHVNLPAGLIAMENEFLRVEFDKLSGGVSQLLDKRTGVNLASPAEPLGVLEFVQERPQGGSAWILGAPKSVVCPLELASFGVGSAGQWSTDIADNSPHVATVTAKGVIRGSHFTVTYQLKADQPWLEITVDVRWVEIGTPETGIPKLNMRFPVALSALKPSYEIPFGKVDRDAMNGRDVPGLRWMDVRNETAGLGILNDSKYGHSLKENVARITLIRSTYSPDPIPEVGDHVIRMAVYPHAADAAVGDLVRAGAAFNHPLLSVATDVHEGALPAVLASAVASQTPGVIVTQIKVAEDGDGVIFRLQETDGADAKANVQVDAALFGELASAVEVDLLERAMAGGTASPASTGFTVSVPASGIASVRARLKAR
ncbi:MAG TPA: glycoside hydrolase family 38 C-terminal domain-containing protein [Armatimonadota bacterium]|jgi:alpha-mannosidase